MLDATAAPPSLIHRQQPVEGLVDAVSADSVPLHQPTQLDEEPVRVGVMKVFLPPEKGEVVAVHHRTGCRNPCRGIRSRLSARSRTPCPRVVLPTARGRSHAVQPTEPTTLPLLALPFKRQHECRLVILELAVKVGRLDVHQLDLLLSQPPGRLSEWVLLRLQRRHCGEDVRPILLSLMLEIPCHEPAPDIRRLR